MTAADVLPPNNSAVLVAQIRRELIGRVDRGIGEHCRAREVCEKLLSYASPLELYAEEIDPKRGRHLGNFPQAFTHLALINAVMHVIQTEQAVQAAVRAAHPVGLLAWATGCAYGQVRSCIQVDHASGVVSLLNGPRSASEAITDGGPAPWLLRVVAHPGRGHVEISRDACCSAEWCPAARGGCVRHRVRGPARLRG